MRLRAEPDPSGGDGVDLKPNGLGDSDWEPNLFSRRDRAIDATEPDLFAYERFASEP